MENNQTNPPPWIEEHTNIIKQIKAHVKKLPCLGLPSPDAFKIVETDASDLDEKEQITRFHSGCGNPAQKNYSTIKKEILAIVLCISKFQNDLSNQNFLLKIDCKSVMEVLVKDWGKSLYLTRRFSQPYDPPYFDYYDYQQAWNKTFLRQNKNLRHSWFLHFDKLQEIKTLLRWFLLWWDQFGPESLILPPPLQESLQAFTLQNDCPPSLSHCSPLLLFFLKTKLNWIMKWEYVIKPHPSLKNIMFLARQVSVKWWEKYNYDHVRSKFQAQLATITNKKDLKKLVEAMSQVSDSDEEEDRQVRLSPAQQTTSSPLQQAFPSQQASHSHDNSPYYSSQMMDSQDPYELELANYDSQIM
ncbi:hypothetical protein I3760_01G268100 [Carya illinoinensis]|nr:hypothetical protein I3760_01G268100 [Carya illinoinensis]